MVAEALHPPKLIIKFLGPDRIAVRQIERADRQPFDLGLNIAAVAIIRITWKSDTPKLWSIALRENRDPVEALLPVPDGAVPRCFDIADRKGFVRTFQLLEADDVGLLATQPFEKARQSCADTVNVVCRKFHARGLAAAN